MNTIPNYRVLKYLIPALMAILPFIRNAKADVLTCEVTPAHISGTLNLKISRFGENYPLNRGDFVYSASTALKVKCDSVFSYLKSSLNGTTTSSAQNTTALQFSNATGIGQSLAISPWFIEDTGGKYYVGNVLFQSAEPKLEQQFGAGADVVSAANWNIPTDGVDGSFTFTNTQAIARAYVLDSMGVESSEFDAVYFDNLTVNYSYSSCGIKSKSGGSVTWSDITKGVIAGGRAPAKPYSLSLICGKSSDAPSPVNITFSSTYGTADATKGIINTSFPGLGIQLSWSNSGHPPLVLDQVNHSTLAGVGDYSVMAKPVAIENKFPDVSVLGGTFETDLTMNIEFP